MLVRSSSRFQWAARGAAAEELALARERESDYNHRRSQTRLPTANRGVLIRILQNYTYLRKKKLMTKKKKSTFGFLHKWFGLHVKVDMTYFSGTGIILKCIVLISPFGINQTLKIQNFTHNWNKSKYNKSVDFETLCSRKLQTISMFWAFPGSHTCICINKFDDILLYNLNTLQHWSYFKVWACLCMLAWGKAELQKGGNTCLFPYNSLRDKPDTSYCHSREKVVAPWLSVCLYWQWRWRL